MITVHFYDSVEDALLMYAVIVARHEGKWVFCKHKDRNTYEIAGGHREKGESILDTANRELFEETGAVEYGMIPICAYSVTIDSDDANFGNETYGMLYFADIAGFSSLPGYEIERIVFLNEIPSELTYPFIQPKLFDKVISALF